MRKRRKHPIITMAASNFDAWVRSPRTVIMLFAIVALAYLEVKTNLETLTNQGFVLNWSETPYFFLSYGINSYMSSIIVLVMVSEIPRRIAFQNYLMVRSDRKQWIAAQLLFCLWLVAFVMLALVVLVTLFSLGRVTHAADWSDTERIAQGLVVETRTAIPQYIREGFTRFTAALYAALPLFCFWFTFTAIILTTSVFGVPILGLLICAFTLLAYFVFIFVDTRYFPIDFATVSTLSPSMYWQAILGYLALNAALVCAIFARVTRADLAIYADNKM